MHIGYYRSNKIKRVALDGPNFFFPNDFARKTPESEATRMVFVRDCPNLLEQFARTRKRICPKRYAEKMR